MAWTNDDVTIDITQPLFYIRMVGDLESSELPFEKSEMLSAWIDKSLVEQDLNFVRDENRIILNRKPVLTLVSVSPNPIVNSVMAKNQQYLTAGTNYIQLDNADFGDYQGVIFLQINTKDQEITERLIRISNN